MPRMVLAAACLVALFAFSGCDASTGGGIDSDEVAEEAQAQLSEASEEGGGGPFPEVTCPDELEEEVGSKMTCFASYDGERHRIRVEVVKVEDDEVELDFTADAPPSK